jgi:extracellular factor (EF) 3-hydroxypalmitic acid methyl ester biosynthesis protein
VRRRLHPHVTIDDPLTRARIETETDRFRALALAKAETPGTLVYDDGAALVAALARIADETHTPTTAVLQEAAALTRPTFCAGWLWNRAYSKPRGYGGDYLLFQKIYDQEASLDPLGGLLDRSFLASPSACALVNRGAVLRETLTEYLASGAGDPILSLGSGPGQELVDVSRKLTSRPGLRLGIPVVCIDIDRRALNHLQMRLLGSPTFRVQPLRLDLRDVVPAAVRGCGLAYSAGLFDYLDDDQAVRVLDAMWEALRPSGRALIGNFCDRRPPIDRFSMDFIMDWHLVYRDEARLDALIRKTRFGHPRRLFTETAGINVFATLEKEA